MHIFHQNLRRLREEKELSQKALAGFAGVSQQAVNRWEQDIFPNIDKLIFLSDFFGLSVDDLLKRPLEARNADTAPDAATRAWSELDEDERDLFAFYFSLTAEEKESVKEWLFCRMLESTEDPVQYAALRQRCIQRYALPYAARHGNTEGFDRLLLAEEEAAAEDPAD